MADIKLSSYLNDFLTQQFKSSELGIAAFLQSVLDQQQSLQSPIVASENTPEVSDSCSSVDSLQVFPRPLDLSQPCRSWWRYFQKRTSDNTALCYSCGACFNRGPKQSTTSLNHHLKMYHRELFIELQQAKDADQQPNRIHDRLWRNEGVNTPNIQKACMTMKLIECVKKHPELYDSSMVTDSVAKTNTWQRISDDIGDGTTALSLKKRWIQIRDRFRKEHKFAVRDNFSYSPKWPYFADMRWYEPYITRDSTRPLPAPPSAALITESSSPSTPDNHHASSEHGSLDDSVVGIPSSESSSFFNFPTPVASGGAEVPWTDDEDMLFARLVGVRLRTASLERKRAAQKAILALLDEALRES